MSGLLGSSLAVLVVAASVAGVRGAEVRRVATREDSTATIAHLKQYVKDSKCVFIRNGDEHTSVEAVEHMDRKYDHYRKKVKTPEDFVRLCATKSLVSGDIYKVRLTDGTERKAGEWLSEELIAYRKRSRP